MSDGITTRTNLPDFSAQMKRLGADFIPVARSAALAGARVFQKEAKRSAPRRTGRLQQAIVVKRARSVPRGVVSTSSGCAQERRRKPCRASARGGRCP
jgi:hypothetical protein